MKMVVFKMIIVNSSGIKVVKISFQLQNNHFFKIYLLKQNSSIFLLALLLTFMLSKWLQCKRMRWNDHEYVERKYHHPLERITSVAWILNHYFWIFIRHCFLELIIISVCKKVEKNEKNIWLGEFYQSHGLCLQQTWCPIGQSLDISFVVLWWSPQWYIYRNILYMNIQL